MRINTTIVKYFIFLLFALCSYSAFPGKTDQERAEAASQALKKHFELGTPDQSSFLLKLTLGKYRKLDKEFDSVLLKSQINPIWEGYHSDMYQINAKNGFTEDLLNNWVNATDSANAYTARGAFFTSQGFEARSTKSAKETTNEQFNKMKGFHKKAWKDFNKAIEINPKLVFAHEGLLMISKASSSFKDTDKVFEEAVAHIPHSYNIIHGYIVAVQPRWGGSYHLMYVTGMEAAKHADINPRLWSLQGDVFAEKGYTALLKKDYNTAIEAYTKALSYGIRTSWLRWRAYSYYRSGQLKKSLADYELIRTFNTSISRDQKMINSIKKKLQRVR